MKKCPDGHIYPDSLSQCPVCEKNAELQTILGKSRFSVHSGFGLSGNVPVVEEKFISGQGHTREDLRETYDNDKTIFIGQALSDCEAVLGGWLVPLNCEDMPIGSYQLFINRKHRIGRSRDNDIVLVSKTKAVSRHHCVIEYKETHFVISDRGAANGTVVNNQRVSSQILTDKSLIVLGDQKFLLKYL